MSAGYLPDPEVHAIDAADGWVLRVFDFRPPGRAAGIVIAGHAMMVDSRTICRSDRPTLCAALVDAGFRVLVPDLRGRGVSGPGAELADWNYDDIVGDVGCYVDLAKALEPELPMFLLGHSLFGHAALAWLGSHPDPSVRAVVCLAVDLWNRRFEPSRVIWHCKSLLGLLASWAVALFGYFPSRRLRLGSADEAGGYWRQFRAFTSGDHWRSDDGAVDYWEGLREIECPVLHVVSEADWMYARPASALTFSAVLARREALVLGRDDAPLPLSALAPTHMGMVTDAASAPVWRFVGAWIRRAAG